MKHKRLSAQSIAPGSSEDDGMFRIVHPFHPHHGRRFPLVTVRQNWGDEIVYYHGAGGRLVSLPARWTDRGNPDPFATISAGRSPFRLEDLLELVRLVAALGEEADR